jgi:hypothetical protein
MLPLTLTSQKQPLSGVQIHRAEDDSTRIPARNQHARRLAASAPVGTQRRKQQHIGLVFRQQGGATRQVPDSAANSAFFSRAPDRGSGHSEAVSRRIPDASIRDGSCDQKISCPGSSATGRAGAAPSNSPQSNQVPPASGSESSAATRRIPRSRQEAGPNVLHHVATLPLTIRGSVPSSDRHSGDSPATRGKSPLPSGRVPTPRPPASADTNAHPECSSIAAQVDDADGKPNEEPSWKSPCRRPERTTPKSRV